MKKLFSKFVQFFTKDGKFVCCDYCGCNKFDLYETNTQYAYARECSACGAPQ